MISKQINKYIYSSWLLKKNDIISITLSLKIYFSSKVE